MTIDNRSPRTYTMMYITSGGSMDKFTRISIRRIFLTPRPNVAYMTAADRLGFPFCN